jgi:hypothetical protein
MIRKNIHAASLGKLGKGKPKKITEKERERRRKSIAHARKFRK